MIESVSTEHVSLAVTLFRFVGIVHSVIEGDNLAAVVTHILDEWRDDVANSHVTIPSPDIIAGSIVTVAVVDPVQDGRDDVTITIIDESELEAMEVGCSYQDVLHLKILVVDEGSVGYCEEYSIVWHMETVCLEDLVEIHIVHCYDFEFS